MVNIMADNIKTGQEAKPAEKPAEKNEKTEEKKPGAKPETKKPKNDIMGDGSDDGDLILEDERVSIALTPENAKFRRSGGGLISLDIINDKGEPESFERVVIFI